MTSKWALNYLSHGWSVIPAWWMLSSGKCACGKPDCGSPGKHPISNGWNEFQTRRPSPAEVTKWWTQYPEANIAVITGKISGLTVLDIDNPNLLFVANTPTVITGRGGRHLYFEGDDKVRNAAKFVRGVDIRGEGGYVIAPPSNHVSGTDYEWEKTGKPVKWPNSLSALYKIRPGNVEIQSGERNNQLTVTAGYLARKGLNEHELTEALRFFNAANVSPPLPYTEVETIANSIFKTHARNHGTTHDFKVKDVDSGAQFKVLSMSEVMRKYSGQEESWIVKDWLPNATCGLVVAPPGHFKTWLLLDLALSVAIGNDFLGHYPVEQRGSVLFIQQEDPMPMLIERFTTVMNLGEATQIGDEFQVPLSPNDIPVYWHCDRQMHFSNKSAVNGMIEAVEYLRPKLVIIDPLYTTMELDDFGASGAQSMLLYKRLRDSFGCSFLVSHHTGKNSSATRERDKAWGSQFLNAWLETGWQINALDIPNVLKITRHFKMSAIPSAVTIRLDITQHSFEAFLVDESSSEVNKNDFSGDLEIRVVALIQTGKITSMRTVQQKLGISGLGTISRIFEKFNIQKDELGIYRMNDND